MADSRGRATSRRADQWHGGRLGGNISV
jgi:hypothetical protein